MLHFSLEITTNGLSEWLRPDPLRWGAYSAPPDSLTKLRGLLLIPQLKRGTPYGNDLNLYLGRYVTATSSRRHLLVGPVASRRRSDASHLRRHDVGPICRADVLVRTSGLRRAASARRQTAFGPMSK